MEENKIRAAAAGLLLGRGVRFKITGAPFLWRLLRINRMTVRALKMGTIAEYSMIMLSENLENADMQTVFEKKEAVCRMIAIAMLNSRLRIKWFSKMLAKRLLWCFPAETLWEIFVYLENVDKVVDFTIITNSLAGRMRMMLSARLGQTAKGS